VPNNLTVTINGKRRDEVLLATAEPIPDLLHLKLEWDEPSAPLFCAAPRDYGQGAYRFAMSPCIIGHPGTFRTRSVVIRYTDGTSETVRLQDTIVIELAEISKRPEHVPLLTAR
jgi:hypothetical protein